MRLEPAAFGRAAAVLPVLSADVAGRGVARLSIANRIFLVGAIPIIVATIIGIASVFLLNQADDGRRGALVVSTVYRNVVAAMSSRDAYVEAQPTDRGRHMAAFEASFVGAHKGLSTLRQTVSELAAADAIASTTSSLERYRGAMGELTEATGKNDSLVADMNRRLATLIGHTDEARVRQHDSNRDMVATLKERDASLRRAQDLTVAGEAARAAMADLALERSAIGSSGLLAERAATFETVRVDNAVKRYGERLEAAGLADEARAFRRTYEVFQAGGPPTLVLDWVDRRLKIDGTAVRALHDQLGELLTYTVQANETEQATQNIAIETLKLGQSMSRAVATRSIPGIETVIGDSRDLGDEIAALPISPLIQTEMLDALDLWRQALVVMKDRLSDQNAVLMRMNETAGIMIFEVSSLNNALSRRADELSDTVRRVLIIGAAIALVAASVAGLLVARSITKPLKRLERGMIDRAANPAAGPLAESLRTDEIGLMARATNLFLAELGKRESALTSAKEHTEKTLDELKKTQSELIQAEKLASLGQLVAGVAHEINTPLGVALTTATVVGEEARRFRAAVTGGQVTREAFDDFVERMDEGSRLINANLERSAHLVQSFKQVAADQASGERRPFRMDAFADELFTSLGPMNKRSGHQTRVECDPGIEMVSYPGALAQVLTNLLSNAYTHGFAGREGGLVTVRITPRGRGAVRIQFADNGRGIPARDRSRIFDPFFTTGRASGSTGLGLHIVFNLVTATLGGTIELDSQPGRGTRFVIDIPTDVPEPQPAPAAAEEAA